MLKTSRGWLAAACLSLFVLNACAAPAAPPVSATDSFRATITPVPVIRNTAISSTATAAPASTQTAPAVVPSPAGGHPIRLDEPFTLKIGESADLSGASDTRVSFLGVLEDTRCPIDVNCVQAGSVRVVVAMQSGGKLARFDLSSLPYDFRGVGAFNGYLVQFMDLAPARKMGDIDTPIPDIDYQVTLRVRAGSFSTSSARFNQPFILKAGQSAGFEGSNLRVTFEGVKQDSRCPAYASCPSSGTATVAVRLIYDGVNQEQILLGADGTPVATSFPILGKVSGSVRANALTPYPQEASAGNEILPNDYEATLVVVNPAAPLVNSTPVPPSSCSELTRSAAQGILGEPVKDQPANIILFPLPENSITLHGLCGYGSVAFTPDRAPQSSWPRVLPAAVQSDHAVVAGKLTGNQRLEQLLSIVSAIDAANPSGRSSLHDRLVTMYSAAAGSRGVLGAFPEAARDAKNVHVSKVGSLGESAIWVWREFEGGRYAALAAEKGETLFLLVTLTNSQRTEDALLGSMLAVMQNMME